MSNCFTGGSRNLVFMLHGDLIRATARSSTLNQRPFVVRQAIEVEE
jgi:hypothetical protein